MSAQYAETEAYRKWGVSFFHNAFLKFPMAKIVPRIPLTLLVLRAGEEILPFHSVMKKIEENKV